MKVILTTNIKKLGKIGDLVNVKDGFARNFLFPQNKALRNNKQNKEYFDKIKEEINTKEKEKEVNAIKLLEELKNVKIEFLREADDKDQLYGAVSKKDIQIYLNEKNIKLLSDDIKILQPIRSLGTHIIEANPYGDLTQEVKVFVNKT